MWVELNLSSIEEREEGIKARAIHRGGDERGGAGTPSPVS